MIAVECSRDSRATTWSQTFVRYLSHTYRPEEIRMVRNHPPRESDPVAANRGSCRVIPSGIFRPIYHVMTFIDNIQCIRLHYIEARRECWLRVTGTSWGE